MHNFIIDFDLQSHVKKAATMTASYASCVHKIYKQVNYLFKRDVDFEALGRIYLANNRLGLELSNTNSRSFLVRALIILNCVWIESSIAIALPALVVPL